jgi:Uma2 family endonuclease
MAIATPPRPAARRLWTYDEMVAELPETNLPVELWDGELIMSPTPRPNHQEITFQFARALAGFVEARKLGVVYLSPLDVVLSPRRVVQPDVFFIGRANLGIVGEQIRGVPDLVCEVISPGSWRRDRVEKKELYAQYGVSEYWIIDPESQTIEVLSLAKGVYRVHSRAEFGEMARSKLLAGFEVNWGQLSL